MKRFHVHVSVADLEQSIRFYSSLFAASPTRVEADYAKWMLEDPGVNFAISTGRQPEGVNHLGFQVDADAELLALHAQLRAADEHVIGETAQECCYARSDKYWVTDPTGIAWETFHTLCDVRVYGEDTPVFDHGASTVPVPKSARSPAAPCCAPIPSVAAEGSCCP